MALEVGEVEVEVEEERGIEIIHGVKLLTSRAYGSIESRLSTPRVLIKVLAHNLTLKLYPLIKRRLLR